MNLTEVRRTIFDDREERMFDEIVINRDPWRLLTETDLWPEDEDEYEQNPTLYISPKTVKVQKELLQSGISKRMMKNKNWVLHELKSYFIPYRYHIQYYHERKFVRFFNLFRKRITAGDL